MFTRLADGLVFGLLGLSPKSPLGATLHYFVMDTAKVFVLRFVIIYLMDLLRRLVSPEWVRAYLRGKPAWLARSLTVGLGAPVHRLCGSEGYRLG